ncbi:hypothetical protein AVEN_196099-1 [Araneus ventricosus]|uniref:Uncharacterized protein n=1 Tax=Araneus ventricosus TaxID=182803 RepID=A0A4Y2WY41_ARAVE|nr:hypothetical protein AVEN_196099-1 [Araneus ventricosus]
MHKIPNACDPFLETDSNKGGCLGARQYCTYHPSPPRPAAPETVHIPRDGSSPNLLTFKIILHSSPREEVHTPTRVRYSDTRFHPFHWFHFPKNLLVNAKLERRNSEGKFENVWIFIHPVCFFIQRTRL